jgi:F-type H+-transporting ATPase subunit b
MEATLHALGEVLLSALPTFFLVVILYLFLNSVFFGPLGRMLKQRYEATEGARKAAAAALDRAQQKADAYEQSLREARNEVYKEQEVIRLKWREQQMAQISEAHTSSQGQVASAKKDLAAQGMEARTSLESTSHALADQITATVMRRIS